jgi:hypothetical protein
MGIPQFETGDVKSCRGPELDKEFNVFSIADAIDKVFSLFKLSLFMGSNMSILYIYHDSKPLYISRNAAIEVAIQLKTLSDAVNKLLWLTKDMQMFTIEILYMLFAHSAIPDKMDHMLMSYRNALEAIYRQVIERLDFTIKIVESVIEEARKRLNENE